MISFLFFHFWSLFSKFPWLQAGAKVWFSYGSCRLIKAGVECAQPLSSVVAPQRNVHQLSKEFSFRPETEPINQLLIVEKRLINRVINSKVRIKESWRSSSDFSGLYRSRFILSTKSSWSLVRLCQSNPTVPQPPSTSTPSIAPSPLLLPSPIVSLPRAISPRPTRRPSSHVTAPGITTSLTGGG